MELKYLFNIRKEIMLHLPVISEATVPDDDAMINVLVSVLVKVHLIILGSACLYCWRLSPDSCG